MLVQSGLQDSALRQPGKTALVSDGQRLSYAEVDAMSDRFACALLANGVRRGDRVAIWLPNCAEAVLSVYGVLKAGATFVFINYSTKFEKLSYILANCQAVALVTSAQAASEQMLTKLRQAHPNLNAIIITGAKDDSPTDNVHTLGFDSIQKYFPAERPKTGAIDLDLACLLYTSGSTGEPKGVMCDHSSIDFLIQSINGYLEHSDRDVILNVLPISFGYGLYQVFTAFACGATLVLENSFAFPVAILKRIEEERATGFPSVPTIVASLLQMDLSRYDLSSLRYMTNAAAPLPPNHILQICEKLPNMKFFSMYGLTETQRTLYLPPEKIRALPGSVGVAIPGTEVWIEGPDGSRLGPNQVGELVARGRHVMRGYWQAPEATANRFRPGLLPNERVCHTGDLFRMDEEGYMYFVSRKDDIIKSRGEKVAPKEIENVLYGMPGVVEAAVVGVPDPILGEAVKAVLVVNASRIGTSDVVSYCRAHLEEVMVPKYIEFRTELPKTGSGKILKRGLA